jgi:hypothetical protein
MKKNPKHMNAFTSHADLYPIESVSAPPTIGAVMDPNE